MLNQFNPAPSRILQSRSELHTTEENTSGCQTATYLRVAAWGTVTRPEHTDELISERDFCLSSTGVSLRK